MFGMSQREKNHAIYKALSSFDAEKLKKALRKGGNPNTDTYYEPSALHFAARMNKGTVAEAIGILAAAGAKLDFVNDEGQTPLHYMIYRSPALLTGIAKLVELGADIHAEDNHGRTPLFIALERQGWEAVELLIKQGGMQKTQDRSGRSLLVTAMEADAPLDIVRKILESDVDINFASKQHASALHLAVAGGKREQLTLLLAQPKIFVDVRDSSGRTPLLAAVAGGGNRVFVQALLDAKATPNLGADDGTTPLTLAAKNGSQEILEILIKGKASLDLPDGDGVTALTHAARDGNIRMVMTLLGAAEEQGIKLGLEAPLAAAAEKGQGRVLEILIGAGADVNKADKLGITPLMKGILSDQIETLGILVKAGAKPDATDIHGLSAYDHAVSMNKGNSKVFMGRYRGEAVKTADNAVPAARTDGYTYSRLNDHSLEVREGDGLSMIFNFWTQQVILRDNERPAPVNVQNFSELQRQEAISEAYEKLKELGGTPPDPHIASMQKKTVNVSLSKP